MTTAPLLRVDGVRAVYGDTVALHDVSLDIGDNEFFALLGPSGCGKTTLLRSIAGFETPESGRIEVDGRDLLGMPAHKRPVNMMFQSYALFPHMSVEKNIAYGLESEGLGRAEIARRVAEVVEVVGLGHLAKRRPSQLSGGQRQRVALARAIVKRPRLLLLDEPLSALDRQVRASMQLELKRLQHEVGLTFVVVTHDQEEAMSMADRIAVLRDGRLEQLATPQELYANPASRFVASFIGSANLLDGVAATTGVEVPGIGLVPAPHGLVAGAPATAVVRPEDVELTDAATSALRGTVIDTYFLGGASTISIEVDGLHAPLLATVHGASRLARGEAVGVRFGRTSVVARDAADDADVEAADADADHEATPADGRAAAAASVTGTSAASSAQEGVSA
ncbi:spermidine/putrescine transport system ATP-binding protein/putrescine transport system ATP-binding protein [Agromyces sp. CF514]|uniref:ABC transporter ATP-binding protein n=1 Tax=Agromyces sp. CF514 TaxID=1881031 RepID=UPI0008E2E7EA|nr:ABC transporter ATP-binding protein [Agromyces sp. CF514]SFR68273.1 spermidine/putrescine transport system ATP-binding protein/putrescine transport system ATP-binding protein [Agromyces sp. CF514]